MKKKNVKYEVGKGSIKRPTNPSDSFRKSKKKMTPQQDAAYDRKHGIKEGSKRDMAQDRRNGVMDKKKQKTQKQVVAHKASSKKQAWMEKVGKGGKNC